MEIGITKQLKVMRQTGFGLYLADENDPADQVLLPSNQVPQGAKTGDLLDVFIYRDSDDRIIATRKTPAMELGKTGLCTVAQIGRIGAFLNWGLEKDLLLPFREMTCELKEGMTIPVALYKDKSDRLCATMKLYHYLDTATGISVGDTVHGTVYEISDNFGIFVAIDDKYHGLIPKRESNRSIKVGDKVQARVTAVKPDGKIDLSLKETVNIQMDIDADRLLDMIKESGGRLDLGDRSPSELIRIKTDMSKNEFKRAVGRLLKKGLIETDGSSIFLK
ncbi:MAG: S1 RNA-binding domain-containing protein [Lachnospiraceae bacterium]|nr:S1 RNA-binding domain-containing protein [Lachnospiraceae bacterium]